jgi:hypothetical protein
MIYNMKIIPTKCTLLKEFLYIKHILHVLATHVAIFREMIQRHKR